MKVLAVAGDAGGARALTPIIRCLQLNGVEIECRAYAAAVRIWSDEGIATHPIFSVEVAGFDKVLLGTSVSPELFELKVIRQAKAAKIPTLSVLDFWTNYRERFTAEDDFVLPDAIAIMDEPARAEMISDGFPEQILHVTGQPVFDNLSNYFIENEMAEKPFEKVEVVYVSQPLSQLYCREELGFDETEVLGDVIAAISDVFERHKRKGIVRIKLHPREAEREYKVEIGQFLEVKMIDAFDDPRRAVTGSDLVVGMNSILLIEACYLGKPVVSYQPNLSIADPLPSNKNGWSRAVYRKVDLSSAIERELFDAAARLDRKRILASIPKNFDATARITKLILVI